MSYTVASKDTRIFRTKITNVNAEFDHYQGTVHFTLNFDNFRTYTSGKGETDSRTPKWEQQFVFNYETEFAELMAAKIMKFTFLNDKGEFIGEASCDLMTLATGPQDCRFSIFSSNTDKCGKVFMNVEMEEVAETCVILKELRVAFFHGKPTPGDMGDARVYIETKAAVPGVRRSRAPANLDAYNAVWKGDLEPNYFGSTVTSILQEAGLRVRLVESSWFSEKDFAIGTISIGALPDDQLQSNPKHVVFQNVDMYDPSGADVVAHASGILAITHMPRYAQMFAGQNIDGVVHDGQAIPGAKVLPPRIRGEVKMQGTKL